MTLIICAKIFDGIVLVADSKNLLMENKEVLHEYHGIQKIFPLHPELQIGIATWGINFIDVFSIPVIIKRFQKEVLYNHEELRKLTVQQFSADFQKYVSEIYQNSEYSKKGEKSSLGFIIAGYNQHEETSVICGFEIDEDGNETESSTLIDNQYSGLIYLGANEYIFRLIKGYSPQFDKVISNKHYEGIEFVQTLKNALVALDENIIHPLTPLNKAQEICGFLMDVAIKFETYKTGVSLLGEPVMIANITKDEGFNWIKKL